MSLRVLSFALVVAFVSGCDCGYGTLADGCGGALDCGSCTSPQTCGGGGIANVCGEVP